MARIRLFIIDPSRTLIEAIHRLFYENDSVQLIGGALTTDKALPQFARLRPDIVLVDLVHADNNTLDFIKSLKSVPEAPQVVVMSLYDAPPYERAARMAGADAFVSKAELITQLEPLITTLPTRSFSRHHQPYANRVTH